MTQEALHAIDKMSRQLAKKSLAEAEANAWKQLAAGDFAKFGYWAGIWTYLNRVSGYHYDSPWMQLAEIAFGKLQEMNNEASPEEDHDQ